MKVIATNTVTSVSATSENSNFPVDNLLDTHPQRVWKAADASVSSATVSVSVSGKSESLAMFNITADAAVISISDPNACQWESWISWESGTAWASIPPDMEIRKTWIDGGESKSLWVDFDQFGGIADINITLLADGLSAETIQAGVVYAGESQSFNNPKYGLQEGLVDYSTAIELSNGSFYYDKGNIVRTFSGTLLLPRDNDFYTFMLSTARANGGAPMAWNIVDNMGDKWAVYARFSSMPTGSHAHYGYSQVSFGFIEVI